jgi:hypothetical protein
MRTTVLIVLVLAVAATSACGGRRTHLTKDWGRSVDSAFATQASERAEPAAAVRGLDPQEAALISAGYRARLAPPGAKPDESRMILVAPQDARGAPQPAPSVPSY